MLYLTGMAYDVLLYLVYLLKSIDVFKGIEIYYTGSVLLNLIGFMANINVILVSSSTFLHRLMEILILHFCVAINVIFGMIKSKLIFYLKLVELQIYVDYALLLKDIELYNKLLLELKLEFHKYISIFEMVNQLFIALDQLVKDNTKLKGRITNFYYRRKSIKKVQHMFYYKNHRISDIVESLSTIKLQKSLELNPDNSFQVVVNLKMNLDNIQEKSKDVIKMNFDKPLIIKFNKCACSIKNIFDIIDTADIVVTEEIIAIIRRLELLEIINLGKLYKLMADIEIKYFEILFRVYLLICTILFYTDITVKVLELFGLMKFDCSNAKEFLSKSSQVENYIKSVSDQIDSCIKKLATACNKSKCLGVPKQLIQLYVKLITRIIWLKFYVDLMMMEILIFKMIIINLIVMGSSSAILDGIIEVIGEIRDIDKALVSLVSAKHYLRAFYFIQLENTLTILSLSSALMFSEFIHEHYRVLLYNLDLINRLIWVIECIINHLIVFKYTSVCLNSIYPHIFSELKIVVYIIDVVKSMFTISDMLNSINNSISQLNNIQDVMDITKWRESAAKIRHETLSVGKDIAKIDSQISDINKNLESIYKSWVTLIYLEYFLLVVILEVHTFIKNTDKPKILGSGLGNDYYTGVVISVLGPCNKQLKFIFFYLVDMWVIIVKLIKVVETTMVLIIAKMTWSKVLTKKLNEHVENINKGVVGMECAIEGVSRNFIKCTLLSTNNTIYSNITSLGVYKGNYLDKHVVSVYSLTSVMDYKVVVNRMVEFWTFSDQSVELFKYIRFCLCALSFETKHRDHRPSTFPYPLHSIRTSDINPVSEFVRQTMADNVGNHMCLCLVIKYHLRTSLLKCILFLRNEELGTLDTLSRKFDNYNSWAGVQRDLWKLCGLVLNIIYELTSLLRNRYLICSCNESVCKCVTQYKSTSGSSAFPNLSLNPSPDQIDSISYVLHKLFTYFVNMGYDITYPLHQGIIPNIFRCCCMYSNDPDYHYIISITLYVSSLIENLWNMDTETMRLSIEKLSILYSQLEIYDLNSTSLKRVCCNPVYALVVDKKCQLKEKDKCCCCWCVTCYNLGIILIYLCHQFKLFIGITSKKDLCDKVKECFDVDDCECTCSQPPDKGVCCLLKLAVDALPGAKGGFKSLDKMLEDCCKTFENGDNCCCKKLKEKLDKALCKLLLLGCNCDCIELEGESQVKGKIVFFKDLNERPRVAVLVFCKCKDTVKECCLTTIIEKFKEPVKKICEDKQCVYEQLKDVCKDICPQTCGADCSTNCGNGCLCKKIHETIGECFKKGKCECKNKGCCKIVAHFIKIVSRACKANILEPYKRIVTDLMCSSKNKQDLMRRIINRITDSTEKKISLCKNYNSNVSSIHGDLTDISSVRNWAYDTRYEHQVTCHNSISGDGYPNYLSKSSLTNALFTHSVSTEFINLF